MADQVYFEDINVGDEIPKLVKNCTTQQLVMWAAGSGDMSPRPPAPTGLTEYRCCTADKSRSGRRSRLEL